MMLKPDPTPGDTSWFIHDRFGLFIHWGLYALATRQEWVKKYFKRFDPDLFLELPVKKPGATVPVVELFLK